MKTTEHNMTDYRLTRHAENTAHRLGYDADTIADTFANPKAFYPSKNHEGQWRMVSRAVCLVGVRSGDTFVVITMHANAPHAPAVA